MSKKNETEIREASKTSLIMIVIVMITINGSSNDCNNIKTALV